MSRADARTPRRPLETVELRRLVESEAERLGGGTAGQRRRGLAARRSAAAAPHGAQSAGERLPARSGQGRARGAGVDERKRDPGRRGRRPRHPRVGAREDLRAVLSAERARGRLGRRARPDSASGSRWCARWRATTAATCRRWRRPRAAAAGSRWCCRAKGPPAGLTAPWAESPGRFVAASRLISTRGHSLAILRGMRPVSNPRVAIVGAGFGGLSAARSLAGVAVDVTIYDRLNYHLFQPLLYQVAMAGLSANEIAVPIRSILWRQPNVDVVLGRGHRRRRRRPRAGAGRRHARALRLPDRRRRRAHQLLRPRRLGRRRDRPQGSRRRARGAAPRAAGVRGGRSRARSRGAPRAADVRDRRRRTDRRRARGRDRRSLSRHPRRATSTTSIRR